MGFMYMEVSKKISKLYSDECKLSYKQKVLTAFYFAKLYSAALSTAKDRFYRLLMYSATAVLTACA
jgi:hypothetical protein